jgi:hypothetical protein
MLRSKGLMDGEFIDADEGFMAAGCASDYIRPYLTAVSYLAVREGWAEAALVGQPVGRYIKAGRPSHKVELPRRLPL